MGEDEWEPTILLFPTYSSAPIHLPKPLPILEEQTAGESERRAGAAGGPRAGRTESELQWQANFRAVRGCRLRRVTSAAPVHPAASGRRDLRPGAGERISGPAFLTHQKVSAGTRSGGLERLLRAGGSAA